MKRFVIVCVAVFFCLFGILRASEHRDKGYQYLSPEPGSEYVLPKTEFILVRFEVIDPYALLNPATFIEVTGAVSGVHPGVTKIASDDRTVIFEMSSFFSMNEVVTVNLTPEVNGGFIEPYEYQFMVSGAMPAGMDVPDDLELKSKALKSGIVIDGAMVMPNGVSVPGDFPEVEITVNDNPADEYIFIVYNSAPYYTMIMDNSGSPVWYKRGFKGRDFKVQKNGSITMLDGDGYIGYDQNFNQVASYTAVNGYVTNMHELQVLEDGGYLIEGHQDQTVDMSLYFSGAKTNATVRETIFQEFTAAGELIFQWRSWDHYDIRMLAFWSDYFIPTNQTFAFAHINAIEADTDGHLLVSSNRLSEVTKIDRLTGEVIWRMGGAHPDPSQDPFGDERLVIVDDPLGNFDRQHDIRAIGENRYTLFDNHGLTPNSRAVEYVVDPDAMTATMVWQYREDPPYWSHSQGNAQRLDNGNTLINWVLKDAPKVMEVRPDGTKAYEMNWLKKDSNSYRVFRFPWEGVVEVPYLLVESHQDNVILIFNKFGDSNVDHYRIYGGTSPNPTTLLDTSESTLKSLRDLKNGRRYYFRVTAVYADGTESGRSNEESALVSFTEAGENMVSNGNFSLGKAGWTLDVSDSASAGWSVEGGQCHLDIADSGSKASDVRFSQDGMAVVEGKEYIFKFDVWADEPRIFEAKVVEDSSGGTDYSRIGFLYATPEKRHYEYGFVMEEPSDYAALVSFFVGGWGLDVYFDNVSLVRVIDGDFDRDGCVELEDLAVLADEWLQVRSGLTADIEGDGGVDFVDFAVMAENWMQRCD